MLLYHRATITHCESAIDERGSNLLYFAGLVSEDEEVCVYL